MYFINAEDASNSNYKSALTEFDASTGSVRVIAGNPNWTASPVGPFGSSDGQTLYSGAQWRPSSPSGYDKGVELYYWDVSSPLQDLTHAASFNLASNDGAGTNSYPQFMIEYDGSLFTRASSKMTTDGELWEFNRNNNSKAEYEIGSGDHNGLAYAPMIVFKDKLYMVGNDNDANTGKELFVFDRSGAPELVMEINPGSGDGLKAGADWWDPTIFNDKLYFVADDGSGSDLWVYDGVSDPTKAYDFQTSSTAHLTSLTVLDDTLYFLGDAGGATATANTIDLWSVG